MDTSLGLTTGPQSAKSENVTRHISSTGHTAINLPIDPGLLDLLGIPGDEIGKLFMCFLAQLAEERQQKARLNNANEAEEAMAFRVRDIVSAAEKAGVTKDDDFKIQYQARTNTIALTTQDEKTAEKLLQLTEVQKGGDQYAIRPYKAIGRDQIRGIIYLPGDNRDETPETLMQDMKCKTSRIVNARLIGKSKNVVLVTFESKKLPKTVIFSNAILGVKEYLPRPMCALNATGLAIRPMFASGRCKGATTAGSCTMRKWRTVTRNPDATTPPESQPRDSYAAAASASTKEPKPAGEISRTGLPAWMPEWANPTPPQTPQTSTFNAEREVDKLQAEMKMGFKALFEVIGELRREIAELKHGK
ncbi:hypothetical protein HPB47_026978 [Ixodes persulcatus]|uniref:Uncharacterized protein n=1 Tax=Ixodes persulcatus TaxID=34615 RepID=A0AC60PXH2_IXOPE|nr:hypothetical protein HPB47_026978 [Ixodes persulcatus]